jgi:hypothetical protein
MSSVTQATASDATKRLARSAHRASIETSRADSIMFRHANGTVHGLFRVSCDGGTVRQLRHPPAPTLSGKPCHKVSAAIVSRYQRSTCSVSLPGKQRFTSFFAVLSACDWSPLIFLFLKCYNYCYIITLHVFACRLRASVIDGLCAKRQ